MPTHSTSIETSGRRSPSHSSHTRHVMASVIRIHTKSENLDGHGEQRQQESRRARRDAASKDASPNHHRHVIWEKAKCYHDGHVCGLSSPHICLHDHSIYVDPTTVSDPCVPRLGASVPGPQIVQIIQVERRRWRRKWLASTAARTAKTRCDVH